MNIEDAKCEVMVSLLEDTKPYYYNNGGKKLPVDPAKIFPKLRYEIIGTTEDGNVQIYCPVKNKAEIIDPKHIAPIAPMKALKIRLYNADQFKPALKKVQSMGYELCDKPPRYAQYIYAKEDGRILFDYFLATDDPFIVWSDDQNPDFLLDHFNEHKAEEVKITDLLAK